MRRHETDEVGTVEGFAAWIERLKAEDDETRELAPGRVPAAYWWIVDDGNRASARTIERNGGVLEDVRETWLGLTRRYWIAL